MRKTCFGRSWRHPVGKMIESSKPLIEPVYSQVGPNQPIELGSVAIQFTHEDKTYQRTANVITRFLPSDRLLFIVQADDMAKDPFWTLGIGYSLIDEKYIELRLTDKGVTVEAFCVHVGADEIAFMPKRSLITTTPRSESLSTVVFHLFNFPDFLGSDDYSLTSGEPPFHGVKRCGRIILKAGGWSITIAATDKTDSLVKSLQQQGGYVITHMGKIEREDGSVFSTEQVEHLLSCVRQFLSFALGRWVGITLPVGFDATGKRVFEQWDLPLTTAGSWNGSYSWFDAHHGGLLSGVFPGFFDLWSSDSWKEHLRVALYWYLAANERSTGIGVDAGIILAQTALERLAWAYCVEHRKMVSQKAFLQRGLSATDKLHMLITTLGIPIELPGTMTTLNAKPGEKWADILDAITSIRNALVHPSEKKSFLRSSHYYEAWLLSMWLLDLVLLRLCKHTGDYANRLADRRCVGIVEQVPWAKQCTAGEGIE